MTNIPATAIIFTHIADTRFEMALRSVQQFAEVLVFDNGSKNTWHSLEKKYTFTRSNLGSTRIKNFAAARNNALQKATYEWVFFLDSDEELLPNNPKLLRDLLTTNNNQAYTVTRSDFFLGNTAVWRIWLTINHATRSQGLSGIYRHCTRGSQGNGNCTEQPTTHPSSLASLD